jgi:hypothetical protein
VPRATFNHPLNLLDRYANGSRDLDVLDLPLPNPTPHSCGPNPPSLRRLIDCEHICHLYAFNVLCLLRYLRYYGALCFMLNV